MLLPTPLQPRGLLFRCVFQKDVTASAVSGGPTSRHLTLALPGFARFEGTLWPFAASALSRRCTLLKLTVFETYIDSNMQMSLDL